MVRGTNGDGKEGIEKFWPCDVHIIGKDILWFHTVIWPCLLMSAGIPLPTSVFLHGFVNDKEGKKMSKSIGNVVDPHDVLDKNHVDSFRWYVHILLFRILLLGCQSTLENVYSQSLFAIYYGCYPQVFM